VFESFVLLLVLQNASIKVSRSKTAVILGRDFQNLSFHDNFAVTI